MPCPLLMPFYEVQLTKMTNYEYLLLRRYQDGLSRNSYYRVSSVVMAEVLRIFNDKSSFWYFFSLSRLIIVMTWLGHIGPRATPQLTMSRLCDCSGSFMAAGHFLYSQIIAQLNSGHDSHRIICLKKHSQTNSDSNLVYPLASEVIEVNFAKLT